jgi:hypothetical protein
MDLPPRPVDLAALLRAHPYIAIERPPVLWPPDADDVPFVRVFGELIAASLVRNGGDLAAVTINVSNVVIEPEAGGRMPVGEFVAVTARGRGEWGPEIARAPDPSRQPPLVTSDLEAAATAAGVVWAYTRRLGDRQGSVTLLFKRRPTEPAVATAERR